MDCLCPKKLGTASLKHQDVPQAVLSTVPSCICVESVAKSVTKVQEELPRETNIEYE